MLLTPDAKRRASQQRIAALSRECGGLERALVSLAVAREIETEERCRQEASAGTLGKSALEEQLLRSELERRAAIAEGEETARGLQQQRSRTSHRIRPSRPPTTTAPVVDSVICNKPKKQRSSPLLFSSR